MPTRESRNIAICQPYIIPGGRFEVILGIVKTLNRLGYVPDILCLDSALSLTDIEQKYGEKVGLNFHRLSPAVPWKKLPQDYQILLFNRLLGRFSRQYDLLVDSSNSQIFTPPVDHLISYVHFPREYRIFSGLPSIHFPDQPYKGWSDKRVSSLILKTIYHAANPKPAARVVCNSNYTRDSFLQMYPSTNGTPEVIYPPVRMTPYFNERIEKESSVVSLGRFAEDKGQLEIIKLAEKLPRIQFHLIGFSQKPDYLNRCIDYMNSHHLKNIEFHVNASFAETVAILQRTKIFLHRLVNEPFGLSAVQGIAAGCIPVVHDSGGQIESVPPDFLRYRTAEDISGIIETVNAMSEIKINELRGQLQSYARKNFSEEVFADRFYSILQPYLK